MSYYATFARKIVGNVIVRLRECSKKRNILLNRQDRLAEAESIVLTTIDRYELMKLIQYINTFIYHFGQNHCNRQTNNVPSLHNSSLK